MKKCIIVLIGLLMVISVFATATKITSSENEIANTIVKLNLDKDYAVVWFSKAANTTSISEYALSLNNPDRLVQNTSGNTTSENKIYAVSNDTTEYGLFLNWNIVSKSNVLITLKINSPLSQTDTSDTSRKIGWTVSWKYTASDDSTGSDKSISLADNAKASDVDSDSVYLKNGSIYGEGSSKQITIVTDNVWNKDKTAEYSANLIAEIKTN